MKWITGVLVVVIGVAFLMGCEQPFQPQIPSQEFPPSFSFTVKGAELQSGGTYDFGTVSVAEVKRGDVKKETFTIENTGSDMLRLQGEPVANRLVISPFDVHNEYFSSRAGFAEAIAPGGSSNATVTFAPKETGSFTGYIIVTGRSSEPNAVTTFTLKIMGTGV